MTSKRQSTVPRPYETKPNHAMLSFIRRLFRNSEPTLSGESRAFIEDLAKGHIWILGVGLRGVPVVPDITHPAGWDIISAHRIDVAELGDDDSISPFNCKRNGKRVFPFFSSEERARHFQANSGYQSDLSLFQPCSLLAGFVATSDSDIFELVLDANSPAERTLTWAERLLLRSLTTPA